MLGNHPLTYLDNAATTQKPLRVIEAMDKFYREDNSNVHRGAHRLSQRSSIAFDAVRGKLARFIGAASEDEIVWTKGCTESINLIANAWGAHHLHEGEVVLLSAMEHHANILPWQRLVGQVGARIIPIPMSDAGELDLDAFQKLLRDHPVKVVGVKHICNALGTINPIAEITRMVHEAGAIVVVDGAQGLAHRPLNVSEVPVDFYALSAHKAYGPTGLGALYAPSRILKSMQPYQVGGGMICTVAWEGSTFMEPPTLFEPGTPHMSGVIGFGPALDFLAELGLAPGGDPSGLHAHEDGLLQEATERIAEIPGIRVIGTAPSKTAVLSFVTDFAHPHDVGEVLDAHGVAVRTGKHCCMPLMTRLGIPATARASFAAYNTREDVDRFISAVNEVRRIFA